MTKDERLLVELFRAAQASGDLEGLINPQEIAKKLGYREVLIKNILKGLRQANFIKIYNSEEVVVTEQGRALVDSLLN